MAFSTQKEFFHVPFMNETVDYECRRACVKLKTYQSTTDDRSWAMDESLQSRFLSDLVTCQTPVGGFGVGDDDEYDEYEGDEAGPAGGQRRINKKYGRGGDGLVGDGRGDRGKRGKRAADDGRYSAGVGMGGYVGSAGPSGSGRGGRSAPQSGYRTAAYIVGDTGMGTEHGGGGVGHDRGGMSPGGGASRGGDGPGGGPGGSGTFGGGGGGAAGKQGQGGLVTADSVLACANEQMGRLQDLLLHKQKLEKQLEVSNERLKVANMENDKIKAIMNDRFDSNHAKDFYNKIQKLTTSGKINKSEENELLQIYNKFEDMNKAYEVLQAENAYLKRLMEKLSLRASYEAIKMEPEKSNDVPFLQNEVNKLRQEVSMLRKYEDDKLERRADSNRNKLPDVDPETLKTIIKERNALREKCKTFKDLEAKVYELQKIANEADKMSDSLSNDLDNQSKHIVNMGHEMKRMQKYYEDQMAKLKFNEEVLKCQLDDMKEDLIRARCSAQKAECLQMEIGCLRNELMRRDLELNDYDCQYKQLMNVIDELQGNAIQNLHDTQTQTCADYMEDLTFFARATLGEIKKELRKRGGDGDKIGGGGIFGGHAITDGLSPEECCAEMRRLQDIVKQLTKQNEILQSNVKEAAEDLCADALKKLEEMEEKYNKAQDYIANLKKDKDDLNIRAMNKLHEFSDRVDKLDSDVGKTAKDTAGMDKDLKESMKLVKEISDIHLKNAELSNAVHAITTRDDEKLIDDLRRRLLEEQAKNNKCQEENQNLLDTLVKRGIDPDLAKKGLIKDTGDVLLPGVARVGPGTGKDAEKGGTGAGQDTQRRGPGVGQDDQRGGPGVRPDDRKGGFGVGQDEQRGHPGVGLDDRRGGGPESSKADHKGESGTGKDDQRDKGRGGSGVGQDDRRGEGPGVGQDAQRGGPGAGQDAQRGGPGVGQDAQRGGPGAGQDAQRGGPGAGQDAQRGGPGAGQDDRRAKGPGAGQDVQRGPGAGQDDRKGKPGAGKNGQRVGPAASQDDERGGPGAGQDAQRGGPGAGLEEQMGGPTGPGTGQKYGPGAGKYDGPGAGQKGGPGAGKDVRPITGPEGGPDDSKRSGPVAGMEGGPTAGREGDPDAGRKDGPAAGRGGGPDAGRKEGPGADEVGKSDALKKDDGEKYEPVAGEVGGADAGQKGGADAGRDGVPGIGGTGVSGPSAGSPSSPTAAADRSGADGTTAGPTGDGSAVGGGITGGGTRGITDATGKGHGVDSGGPGRLQIRSGASPSGGGGKGRKGKISDAPGDDAFQQFIDVNATTMMSNIKAGSALEKELRGILNAFMMECGFCFCKSLVPKSKFYALCHKLLHSGIQCMSFRELAYMHRKVFMAADKLRPGFILNMILTEQGFKDGERLKCCHCKNVLCCSNSEEMLKEKLCKLEGDIGMLKEHLDSLMVQPRSPKSPYTARGKTYRQMDDSYSEAVEELLTCREAKPALSKTTSKHMKTLKARIMKCSDLLR